MVVKVYISGISGNKEVSLVSYTVTLTTAVSSVMHLIIDVVSIG
jgi:hypothetical protein